MLAYAGAGDGGNCASVAIPAWSRQKLERKCAEKRVICQAPNPNGRGAMSIETALYHYLPTAVDVGITSVLSLVLERATLVSIAVSLSAGRAVVNVSRVVVRSRYIEGLHAHK